MRLQGALDNDVHIAVKRFIDNGVEPEMSSLYAALQRSNSSLKRRPKKTLEASLERVLSFIEHDSDHTDPDAKMENGQQDVDMAGADLMNRSIRANLLGRPSAPSTPVPNGDETTRKRRADGENVPKRQKISLDPPSDVSLGDIGGMNEVIEQLTELLVIPLQAPEIYTELKHPPPRGVLLHGPPGCGKTMLVRAFASHLGKPFIQIQGPSIVSSMSGDSEKGIRERFEEASKSAPCLLFIDEIDAIAPKRDSAQSQMEKRIVAQLLVSMDDLQRDSTKPVVVIAASNRPDSIDPALRRGGRFGSEININVPNEQTRRRILETQTRNMSLAADMDFGTLAKMTAGFVGADLFDLVAKAGNQKIKKYYGALVQQSIDFGLDSMGSLNRSEEVKSIDRFVARTNRPDLPKPYGFDTLTLEMDDFLTVLPKITPSSKREGFATVPDVSWKDVGALEAVRKALQKAIVKPIKQPELHEALGLLAPSGVLLWGPPGCGKTLLAKAVAAESRANFISIKGPELYNKFLGESEAAVRRVFARARSSIPCVIFFDELDALVPKRDDSGSEASSRVVNTLLTELDGLTIRAGIYVVAATNRPDRIDPALLRPGRLETPLFVDLPGPEERVEIFRTITRNKPGNFSSDIEDLVRTGCPDYSGADLNAFVRIAGEHVIDREGGWFELQDFEHAVTQMRSSVQDPERYRRLKSKFAQA